MVQRPLHLLEPAIKQWRGIGPLIWGRVGRPKVTPSLGQQTHKVDIQLCGSSSQPSYLKVNEQKLISNYLLTKAIYTTNTIP